MITVIPIAFQVPVLHVSKAIISTMVNVQFHLLQAQQIWVVPHGIGIIKSVLPAPPDGSSTPIKYVLQFPMIAINIIAFLVLVLPVLKVTV